MRSVAILACLMVFAWGCGSSGGGSSANQSASVETFKSGGNYPEGIGVDASDNVWVANRYSNSVAELSNSGKVLATFPVGVRPHGLKIDRGNTQNIWVENTVGGGPDAPACPSGTTGTVTALDSGGTLIGTFCTDGDAPQHAQFDSSGDVWVTNQGSNTVAELNGSGALLNTFNTGKNPHAIAVDQSGNFWIGNYYDGTITVLSALGLELSTVAEVGLQPTGNSIDSEGNLWQSVQSLDVVAGFEASPSFASMGTHPVGLGPRGVTIDHADNIFVANQESNDVFKFDSSGNEVAHYKVGGCPENMAIDSKGDLWVSDACASTVTKLHKVAVPFPSGDGDSNG